MKAAQFKIHCLFCLILTALCLSFSVKAQSSDQNFPTPVTTNEISGIVKARDIGDSRLTTYFYEFDGGQGDIFINVVTKNLSGDIDIFAADGLRPLTKMVVYADAGINETGRLVYLRKPERLLLRVEGRTPGDDTATFKIKFAGSFVALKSVKGSEETKPVIVAKAGESGIRVNSVGTIISDRPKKIPPVTPPKEKTEVAKTTANPPPDKPKAKQSETSTEKETVSPPAVVISSTIKEPPVETEPVKKPVESKRRPTRTLTAKPKTPAGVTKPGAKAPPPAAKTEEKKPDPLANIRLVVQLKNGTVIEKRLNEIVKFSVDNGVLLVIFKNGNIARYSMLVVAKVTIE